MGSLYLGLTFEPIPVGRHKLGFKLKLYIPKDRFRITVPIKMFRLKLKVPKDRFRDDSDKIFRSKFDFNLPIDLLYPID